MPHRDTIGVTGDRNYATKFNRLSPKNREEAFVFQFEDDVRVLHCCALVGEADFEKALQTIEAHISAYRNKNLKKQSAKAQAKNKENVAFMKRHKL